MHGKSHACSEVGHDEHHHVVRKPSGMHSACHEEGNEQLAVEQASRERMAHEEPPSQTKTKKNRMQQANSTASLVGSVRVTTQSNPRKGKNERSHQMTASGGQHRQMTLRIGMTHKKRKTSSTVEVKQSRPGKRAGCQTTACMSLRIYPQKDTSKYEVLVWSMTTNHVVKT